DTDWEGPDECRFAAARDFEAFVIDFRLHRAIDAIEEVLAVITKMESQEIIAEEAFQQFFLPGECLEYFGVRPRNMPEVRDDQVAVIALLQYPRQQAEVIILDE